MSDEVTERPDDVQLPASWQYPFDFTAALTIEPADTGSGWVCRPERIFAAATPAWGLSQADLAAARTLVTSRDPSTGSRGAPSELGPEGVAEAFVELLRHEAVPPVPGFRVVRLVPPPEAIGERIVEQDAAAQAVVVGERVIVTWVTQVPDADHAGPRSLAHLDAVDFFGVVETHGILLWTTPSGREVPVAWATKYLPRASDGWDWCVDLTERALGLDGGGPRDPWTADFPARLGRLAAKLHVALATPSRIVPEPTGRADPDLIRAWHAVASDTLRQAEAVARAGTLEGLDSVLLPRLEALTHTVDALLEVADDTCRPVVVQRVHGDLNVGQVLRWPGGLAVTDFHPDPALEFRDLRVGQAMQPAARDLARLLRSVDHVARVVDKRHGFSSTDAVDVWSRAARRELLEAYQSELAAAARSELLDERLVAAFEAEQLCREIVYAAEHLPAWVYAPLGGLWQEYPATVPATRGRRARHAGEPALGVHPEPQTPVPPLIVDAVAPVAAVEPPPSPSPPAPVAPAALAPAAVAPAAVAPAAVAPAPTPVTPAPAPPTRLGLPATTPAPWISTPSRSAAPPPAVPALPASKDPAAKDPAPSPATRQRTSARQRSEQPARSRRNPIRSTSPRPDQAGQPPTGPNQTGPNPDGPKPDGLKPDGQSARPVVAAPAPLQKQQPVEVPADDPVPSRRQVRGRAQR